MEKFTYKLKTLSSLITSPRAQDAFYKALGEFGLNEIRDAPANLDRDKLKVIYPFYRYGDYSAYAPKNLEYYLPGSSVKGALVQGTSVLGGFMVDDVPIRKDYIVLRNLYKAQYLKEEEKARVDVFFENIGVEMLKDGIELQGEFYIQERAAAIALLKTANASTKVKINQMLEYVRDLEKEKYDEDMLCTLRRLDKNLTPLLEEDDVFLMGGYKGLLHTMELKFPPEPPAGVAFLDMETMLPHGLVRLELLPCN